MQTRDGTVAVGHPVPLSGAQIGVWFAHQLERVTSRYSTAEFVDISGPTDVDRLVRAVHAALNATTALHVRFVLCEGVPFQVPAFPAEWLPAVTDLRAEANPPGAALALMRADLAVAIELNDGPLFRTRLFRVAADRFLWYLRVHGIALDSYGFDL